MDILEEIEMLDVDFECIYQTDNPIFKAFGCVVIERVTLNGYVYMAVNQKTGALNVLLRRKTFISPNDSNAIMQLLEKLKASRVASYGLFEADRHFGEKLPFSQCKNILMRVFEKILPQYGFNVRKEQISLAEQTLDAISGRKIMLAEAGVGIGKTLAYLTSTILAKRGRINDFWNIGYYPKMQYAHMAYMPIVVATSSIALQKAIINEYIPQISNILVKEGIIKTPITAVLRKGRGHYVCERKLRAYIQYETKPHTLAILQGLLIRPVPKLKNQEHPYCG